MHVLKKNSATPKKILQYQGTIKNYDPTLSREPFMLDSYLAAWNIHSQCLPVIPVPPFPVTLCALMMTKYLCVKTVITRRPPLLREAHQELLSPHLSLRNAGEGEGDRLAEQPIKIGRPVQLPQWPRMSAGPIREQVAQERPSRC